MKGKNRANKATLTTVAVDYKGLYRKKEAPGKNFSKIWWQTSDKSRGLWPKPHFSNEQTIPPNYPNKQI